MILVKIGLLDNIEISGEVQMFIKRKFSWNSKISLDFMINDKTILKSSHFPLPLCRERIHYSNLEHEFSLTDNDKSLILGSNTIMIVQKMFYVITRHLFSIFLNGDKITDVYIKKRSTAGIEFEFELPNFDYSLKLYTVILIVINYSDIDGGE